MHRRTFLTAAAASAVLVAGCTDAGDEADAFEDELDDERDDDGEDELDDERDEGDESDRGEDGQ